jgi:ABC-type transport system substrate-binding protein
MDLYTARPFQVDRYSKMTEQYYVLERPTTTYEYLGFNCRKGPLANKRVRLAMSMAIDVEKIIKYVEYDQAQRIAGPAYPVLPWYDKDYRREHTWLSGPDKGKTEKLEFIPYNIEEAQAILKEQGYTLDSSGTLIDAKGNQFRVRIVNSGGAGSTRTDIAMLARENWEKLGVRVDYEDYEWNVFISQYVKPGNFDVIVLGWSGGLSFDKRQLFHTEFTPPNGLNFAGLANPEIDGMMDRILQVYDPDQQIELSHEIFAALAEECPYVFLYSDFATSVMDRRIVWQREATGGGLENLPVNHQQITTAKQSLLFFVPELKRLDEPIPFTEEDLTR